MFTDEVEKSIKNIFDFVKIRILQDSNLCPACFFFRSGTMIEFQEIIFFTPMIQRIIWQLIGLMGQRKLADSVLYVNFIRSFKVKIDRYTSPSEIETITKMMKNPLNDNSFQNAVLFTFINFVTGESKSLVSNYTKDEDNVVKLSELKEHEDEEDGLAVLTHDGGIVQHTLTGYQMISAYAKAVKIDEEMCRHIKILDPKFRLADFLKDFFSGENFNNPFDDFPPFEPPEPPTI